MMHDDIDRLIDDELDGANDPATSARLRERLAADRDARDRFDELKRVRRALEAVPAVDPPADLRDAIMSVVHSEARRPAQPAASSWSVRFADAMRHSFTLRAAPAFALGALVAAIGVAGWSRLPVTGPLSGTIAPAPAVEPLRLETADAVVTVAPRADGLAIETRSDATVDLELTFDPILGGPAGIDWTELDAASIELSPGRLHLTLNQGNTGFLVPWHGSGAVRSPVRVTFRTPSGTTQGALELGSEFSGR
jgi:hypothetical protein